MVHRAVCRPGGTLAAVRTLAAVLAAGVVVAGMGCGIFGGGGNAPAPPAEVRPSTLNLIGDATMNTCGRELSNALAVRVYQLNATANASVVPQARLWEADEEELGDQLLFRSEMFLNPGTTESLQIVPRPGAQFLMVAGNFCLTQGDCWRWIGPVPKAGETLNLRFGVSCVTDTVPATGAGE